jgi:hypothetical protein
MRDGGAPVVARVDQRAGRQFRIELKLDSIPALFVMLAGIWLALVIFVLFLISTALAL